MTYSEKIKEQAKRFNAINKMVVMTVRGVSRALIISGEAGVGKSHDVMDVLEQESSKSDIEYKVVKGYMRPTGLYSLLYEMRKPNQVLVLDDCDAVLGDETGLNLLKAALDMGDKRQIDWRSKANLDYVDEETGEEVSVPKSFEYQGSIIFITNVDFDERAESSPKLAPHLKALISRSAYIDLGIKTKLDKLIRCVYVAYDKGMLLKRGLTEDQRDQVLEFMHDNLEALREVSIRMVVKIANLVLADSDTWKDMAEVTCLRQIEECVDA